MSLKELAEQLKQLKHQYVIAAAEARQTEDSDLTAEGLQKLRASRVDRVRAQFLPQLGMLESQINRAADALSEDAARVIPASQGSTRDAWERVQMLLEAGKGLSDIITDSDAAQLQAIQEWGPTWLSANRHKAKGVNIGAGYGRAFENSIRDRWAELLPNGDIIREAQEAKPLAAELQYSLGSLRTELEGKPLGMSTLASAFGATQAAEEAGQRLEVRGEDRPNYSEIPA